jgi:hypothetical protein
MVGSGERPSKQARPLMNSTTPVAQFVNNLRDLPRVLDEDRVLTRGNTQAACQEMTEESLAKSMPTLLFPSITTFIIELFRIKTLSRNGTIIPRSLGNFEVAALFRDNCLIRNNSNK